MKRIVNLPAPVKTHDKTLTVVISEAPKTVPAPVTVRPTELRRKVNAHTTPLKAPHGFVAACYRRTSIAPQQKRSSQLNMVA